MKSRSSNNNGKRASATASASASEEMPQSNDNNAIEYAVEYLYGKRFQEGALKYLVKWENYPNEESSFEPVANLDNVSNNILGFERKMSALIFRVALLNTAKCRLPTLPQQASQQIIPPSNAASQLLPQKNEHVNKYQCEKSKTMNASQCEQNSNNIIIHGTFEEHLAYQQYNDKENGGKDSSKRKNQKQYQEQEQQDKPIQLQDPTLPAQLMQQQQQHRVIVDDSLKYGNFNNGDLPKAIVKHAPYTRIQRALGNYAGLNLSSSLYFKVDFLARPSGVVPASAYVSFEEIRDKHPKELLAYYYQHAILLDPIPTRPQDPGLLQSQVDIEQTSNTRSMIV